MMHAASPSAPPLIARKVTYAKRSKNKKRQATSKLSGKKRNLLETVLSSRVVRGGFFRPQQACQCASQLSLPLSTRVDMAFVLFVCLFLISETAFLTCSTFYKGAACFDLHW
jgi:hypothetical protein